MRTTITAAQRKTIAGYVRLARWFYRIAAKTERAIIRILAPADRDERVNIEDAVLRATANEMNTVAEMLRSLGVTVKRR